MPHSDDMSRRDEIDDARRPSTEPERAPPAGVSALVPILVFMAALAVRIPSMLCPRELNVDESLLAAQAMRYGLDIVPWRSVDSTTSGPLNCLPIYVVQECLWRPSYRGIHALAAVIQAGIMVVTWLTLRRLVATPVAVVAILHGLAVLATAQAIDYVHFSSELVPSLLLASASYCVVRAVCGEAYGGSGWWLAANLLAGLAPWAKLQSAPISMFIFAFSVLHMLRSPGHGEVSMRARLGRLAAVAAAFGVPSLLMMAGVWFGGAGEDFWQSYVVRNLRYSRDLRPFGVVERFVVLLLAARPTRAALLGIVIFAAIWCWWRCPGWPQESPRRRSASLFFAGSLGAAVASVVKPPWGLPHYEWFLFNPAIILAALVLGMWHRHELTSARGYGKGHARAMSTTCFVALMLGLHLSMLVPCLRAADGVLRGPADAFVASVSRRVEELSPQGETLGVWGWAPALHVMTGLPPASRHAIGHYLIEPSDQMDFFRAAYLKDLRASEPAVVVDAVAPGFFRWGGWSEEHRVDSFEGLRQFIETHYRLVDELRVSPESSPVRIYARTSLLDRTRSTQE